MDRITLGDVCLPEEVYGKCGSKSSIHAKERAGKFPQRRYLDADSPHPRRPFWLRSDVEKWLADQVRQGEEARAKAGAVGARLVVARHLKAAA